MSTETKTNELDTDAWVSCGSCKSTEVDVTQDSRIVIEDTFPFEQTVLTMECRTCGEQHQQIVDSD